MLRIGDAGCQVGDQDGVRTAEQLAPTLEDMGSSSTEELVRRTRNSQDVDLEAPSEVLSALKEVIVVSDRTGGASSTTKCPQPRTKNCCWVSDGTGTAGSPQICVSGMAVWPGSAQPIADFPEATKDYAAQLQYAI